MGCAHATPSGTPTSYSNDDGAREEEKVGRDDEELSTRTTVKRRNSTADRSAAVTLRSTHPRAISPLEVVVLLLLYTLVVFISLRHTRSFLLFTLSGGKSSRQLFGLHSSPRQDFTTLFALLSFGLHYLEAPSTSWRDLVSNVLREGETLVEIGQRLLDPRHLNT
jgi:hypothetical protein